MRVNHKKSKSSFEQRAYNMAESVANLYTETWNILTYVTSGTYSNVVKLESKITNLNKIAVKLESALNHEYVSNTKAILYDGAETIKLIGKGLLELVKAVGYIIKALAHAHTLLLPKILTNKESKHIQKDIHQNLKLASSSIKNSLYYIKKGLILGIKTFKKIEDISSKVSFLFTSFENTANFAFSFSSAKKNSKNTNNRNY